MGFGYGLAGFANGLNGGLDTGSKLYGLIQQDELAKVREQGISEAKAAQAAATPQVTDLGDQNNLTANPQQSVDPNYTPDPVNTSLSAAIQHANDQQAVPNDDARAAGIQTYAVQQPDASPAKTDTDALSSVPQSSQAPGTDQTASNAPADNLDANAQTGKVPLTPSKRFVVDGQGFDTQEEAANYVKQATPKLESFYYDKVIPKVTDTLIAQGKIDQAKAWQDFADQDQTRQNVGTWAKAIKLADLKDYDGAAGQLFSLYHHYDDGYDLVSTTPAKGPDGSSGFIMKVKGPDGQVQEIFQNSKTITEMGLHQLAPAELFQQQYKRQTNADVMQAKAAYDQQNDERTLNRSLLVAGKQGEIRQAVATTQAKSRETVADKRDQTTKDVHTADQSARDQRQQKALDAKAKHDADLIKAQGQYRKAVSPEERRAMIVTHLSSDPMFSMKSPQDQQAQIDRTMSFLSQGGQTSAHPATPAQQGISQPAPGAQPQQSSPAAPPIAPPAPPGKKSVPVIDPVTGQVKYVFR